jgi:hypothetical protein
LARALTIRRLLLACRLCCGGNRRGPRSHPARRPGTAPAGAGQPASPPDDRRTTPFIHRLHRLILWRKTALRRRVFRRARPPPRGKRATTPVRGETKSSSRSSIGPIWGIAIWSQDSAERKAGYRVAKPTDNKPARLLGYPAPDAVSSEAIDMSLAPAHFPTPLRARTSDDFDGVRVPG